MILKSSSKFFKKAIVLTGGIATGKSTVAKFLISNGYDIIDADKIAHQILDKNNKIISNLFGSKYIENNKVLRKKLGELIFNNPNEKQKLENFIHPLIKDEIIYQSNLLERKEKYYFIDIPLYFETRRYNIKKSILVYTTKDIQLKRLISRDMCDKGTALARIDSQISIEEKRKLSTYIIDNTKDIAHLKKEINKLIKDIL